MGKTRRDSDRDKSARRQTLHRTLHASWIEPTSGRHAAMDGGHPRYTNHHERLLHLPVNRWGQYLAGTYPDD